MNTQTKQVGKQVIPILEALKDEIVEISTMPESKDRKENLVDQFNAKQVYLKVLDARNGLAQAIELNRHIRELSHYQVGDLGFLLGRLNFAIINFERFMASVENNRILESGNDAEQRIEKVIAVLGDSALKFAKVIEDAR
jgi:hypothetical protein